jgi:hypothetical protein
MALSVSRLIIISSDDDKKIVKAMNERQDFETKVYTKQRSIESYFKKQET